MRRNLPFLLLLLFAISFINPSKAQVVLLDPNGAGGFESGTTFAANGWTAVLPASQARTWWVGTAAGAFQGTRAAYVGTNTTNNGIATASVQHFYRDIAIPATAINPALYFYIKQPTTDANYDFVELYFTTPANTPVANVSPYGNTNYTLQYSNSSTAFSTWTQRGAYNLSAYIGQTVRVVFSFEADGFSPYANPAIDAVRVVYSLPPCDNVSASNNGPICAGQTLNLSGSTTSSGVTYSWTGPNGFTSTEQNPTIPAATTAASGTYTLALSGTCNSTTSTTVEVNAQPAAVSITPDAATICADGTTTLTASGGVATGAINAQIGSGTTTTVASSTSGTLGPNPMQNYYGGTRQQSIITVAELNAMGITGPATITNLSVQMATISPSYALNNFTIKLGNLIPSAFTGFNFVSGATTVKNPASYQPVAGWNNFTLDAPFAWNGTNNLLVEFVYSNNNTGATGTTNSAYYHETTGITSLYYRADNQTFTTVSNVAAANFNMTGKNNYRLTAVQTTSPSFTWSSSGTLSGTRNEVNTVSPTATTTYTATSSANGCEASATATVTVNSAASNVALAPSSVTLVEACTEGGWTYYTDASNAASPYYFGIQWDPNNDGSNATARAAATASITVDGSYYGETSGTDATYTMRRYWDVDLNGQSLDAPVNVRFFYAASEQAEIEAARDAFIAATPNTTAKPNMWFKTITGAFVPSVNVTPAGMVDVTPLMDVSGGSSINGVLYAQFNGVEGFSGGTLSVGASATPQPIDLVSFTGIKASETLNKLEWNVSCSDNRPNTIELQRSNTNGNFTKIYSVVTSPANCGSVFDYNDAAPLNGNNYYRLKMVDADGVIKYSHVVLLNNSVKGAGFISLSPNPAKDVTTIRINSVGSKTVNLNVIDATGRTVVRQNASLVTGINNIRLDVSRLSAGMYQVVITDKSGVLNTIKLSKQ